MHRDIPPTPKVRDIVFLDGPQKIDQELPLENVYVIDNYLEPNLHRWVNKTIKTIGWTKNNVVRDDANKAGFPNHEFWGSSLLVDTRDELPHNTKQQYAEAKKKNLQWVASGEDDRSWMARWFNRKVQTDFGFTWERFDYCGTNSQTQGITGTCHTDCQPEDSWNLSFLYYPNTFWSPSWGGDLNFYSKLVYGKSHLDDELKSYLTHSVAFKPNRLLMFDGRISHQADAPHPSSRYIDRKSIVLRGSEVKLVDEDYWNNANDYF